MAKISWYDRALALVAPRAAVRRLRHKQTLDVISRVRGYEAASKNRRTSGWHATNDSQNTENLKALPTLRARSRDLVRNDGYAAKAMHVLVENVVGTGIIAKPVARAAGKRRMAQELWKKWAESTVCDFDGQHDFYGLQGLIMRELVEAGEVLVRRIKTGSDSGLPVPLQLQVLECDHIDTARSEQLIDGYIVQGVEFNKAGKRVAYWLFDQHPGDVSRHHIHNHTSARHLAQDVLHLYRVDRVGQVRGTPWLTPVMLTLKDFNEYTDAQLVRQKIAAAFVGFVYDSEPPVDEPTASDPIEKIEAGTLEYLPPGKDIKFSSPPGVDGYAEYASQELHRVAAGLGIPYEALTGNLSQVNFSSIRMGWLEFHRNIEGWRWRMLIPRLCNPVWSWFVEAADLNGAALDGVSVEWTCPRREMIDPTKEIAGVTSAMRSGLMSLSEAIRQSGYDPELVLAEINSDNKLLDKLGIILDSDPRQTSKAGLVQPAPMDQNTNPSGDEAE